MSEMPTNQVSIEFIDVAEYALGRTRPLVMTEGEREALNQIITDLLRLRLSLRREAGDHGKL